MEQIYLVSSAGFPNYGDEIITLKWLRFLSAHKPNAEVWLDSTNPSHAAFLFKDAHPKLHFVNTLWQLMKDINKVEKVPHLAGTYTNSLLRNSGKSKEVFGIELLKNVNVIHFLGGGYINSVWRDHYLLLQTASILKEINPDILLYGTGLGLFPQSQETLAPTRDSLKLFDHLSVRDQESSIIAETPLGYDDAFLGLEDDVCNIQKQKQRAFISLQQDVVGRNEAIIPKIVKILVDSGIEPDEPIMVFEALIPGDNWALKRLQELWFGQVSLLPFKETWEMGFPVGEDALWVSSRFHMHLLAASHGMRGVALLFDNSYYHNKHKSLFDLNTGWSSYTLDSPNNPKGTINADFPSIAREIAQDKESEAIKLYGN